MKMVDIYNNNIVSERDSSTRQELLVQNVEGKLFEQNPNEEVHQKPDTFFLYFVAITADVLLFICSSHHVWTSPVLPILQSNNTDINPIGRPITTLETSMLAGLPFFLGLAGSLFVGYIADFFGRKKTMCCMALTVLLCAVIIAFSNDVYIYIVVRCIIITIFSACTVILPVYLLEICEDHNRGKFGCLMGVALPLGHLYTYTVGSLVPNVTILTLLCSAASIPYLINFYIFAPESPVFLVAKGRIADALKVLGKLRNNKSPKELEKEYDKLCGSIKAKANAEKVGLVTLFRCNLSRKALLLCLIPLSTQHLSGVTVIMQFMAPIFNEAGTYLSGHTISIIAGVVKIVIFFCTAMIVEKLGRKILLLTSGICTSVALFFLGLYFYWKHTNWVHLDKVLWLPIFCLLLNLVVYSIGLGPIPMAIMSEMFSGQTRAMGISVVMTFNGITIAFLNFFFPIVTDNFGVHVCIWFFSLCTFLGTIAIKIFVPETKGKSVIEIQEVLTKVKPNLKLNSR